MTSPAVSSLLKLARSELAFSQHHPLRKEGTCIDVVTLVRTGDEHRRPPTPVMLETSHDTIAIYRSMAPLHRCTGTYRHTTLNRAVAPLHNLTRNCVEVIEYTCPKDLRHCCHVALNIDTRRCKEDARQLTFVFRQSDK